MSPCRIVSWEIRLTRQVGVGAADFHVWNSLKRKDRLEKLEQLLTEDLVAHGFEVGNIFDLSDIDEFQSKLYPEFQVVVLSACHGNAVISRSPSNKLDGMREIVVYHNADHYDLVTSLEGFLMSGNYCEH